MRVATPCTNSIFSGPSLARRRWPQVPTDFARSGRDSRFNRNPTFIIALIAGTSSRPSSVSEYSTDGGDVGITLRVMTPLLSSSRNRALSTFAEMAGMSRRSSLKRRSFALKYQTTFGVQAPPSSDMHSVSGHSGGATFVLRIRNPISPHVDRRRVTKRKLDRVTSRKLQCVSNYTLPAAFW